MKRKVFGGASAALAVLVTGLLVATTLAPVGASGPGGQHREGRELRPVIFVHGGAGSGAQFESQAQRLNSNGYPWDLIYVHEYDSSFSLNTMEQVHAGLDALIAEALEKSGADQVDLLGHSLGTAVSQGYLNSSPERAAKVAHYVNIDGAAGTSPPGGVDTLAVWGEGNQQRQIVGAQNYYAPDQSHVQVATSAETFGELYEFFTGRAPRTIDVVPERPDRVRISGEVNYFPQNNGVEGATLEIWEINRRTGMRVGRRPHATYEIGADGAWGPVRVNGRRRYEFAVSRPDANGEISTHHFYTQNFFRSDHFIRLLTSEPGTGIDLLRDQSDHQLSATVVRYKEMWGDQQGESNDVLEVNGENILNAVTAPRSERVNAVFVVDDNSDGVTHLDSVVTDLSNLPFISGIDVFVEGRTPPDDTVSFDLTSRATDRDAEEINVPNWASDTDHISVIFRDYEQEVESYERPRR
jgi:pimeloyl-ACP methyl ester carboxylesterase